MGQYHQVYNLDKRQTVDPHAIDNGAKLIEQLGYPKSLSTALYLLITNSNGRGGGDAQSHHLIGNWSGDRIVVQGDYAEEGDPAYISKTELEGFTDISAEVLEMLNTAMARYQH